MKKLGNSQTKWLESIFSRPSQPNLITPKQATSMFAKIFWIAVVCIAVVIALAFIIAAVVGFYIFLGWLFAIGVNFVFGTTYTMWQGTVAILILSFVGGLLFRR